jgi:hypothetical protein
MYGIIQKFARSYGPPAVNFAGITDPRYRQNRAPPPVGISVRKTDANHRRRSALGHQARVVDAAARTHP